MSRTLFLAAIALAALLVECFPHRADTIKWMTIGLGVLYLLLRALRTYPRQFRDKRRRAAQESADRQEFRRYETELESLRLKYDPDREFGRPAAKSPEYEAALTALHDKYQAMLTRKFGR